MKPSRSCGQSVSTLIIRPSGMPSRSRSKISRSKIDPLLVAGEVAVGDEELLFPWAICRTSVADAPPRPRHFATPRSRQGKCDRGRCPASTGSRVRQASRSDTLDGTPRLPGATFLSPRLRRCERRAGSPSVSSTASRSAGRARKSPASASSRLCTFGRSRRSSSSSSISFALFCSTAWPVAASVARAVRLVRGPRGAGCDQDEHRHANI